MGAPYIYIYIYDISRLRVNIIILSYSFCCLPYAMSIGSYEASSPQSAT